jgi:hypothetical protein
MCCGGGGGWWFNSPKTKKGLKKELKTGDIKLPMSCAVNVVGHHEINPLKITKWVLDFFGPKMALAITRAI